MTVSTAKAVKLNSLLWNLSIDKDSGVWQKGLKINGKPVVKKGQVSSQIVGDAWDGFGTDGGDTLDSIMELVDNCIDANATEIRITYKYGNGKNGRLLIQDNGGGMTLSQLKSLARIGDSKKKTGSGQYGFGVKTSFARLGSVLEINSAPGVGTTLGIRGLTSRSVKGNRVMREIGINLKPALDRGLRVWYNNKEVKAFQPEWEGGTPGVDTVKRPKNKGEFTIQFGNAANDRDSGWYVYKGDRRVTGYRRGPNDGDKTMVIINLVPGGGRKVETQHWSLNASNKSTFNHRSDWQFLQEFVTSKTKDQIEASKRNRANKARTRNLEALVGVFNNTVDNPASPGDGSKPTRHIDPGGTDLISPDPDGPIVVPHGPSGPPRRVPRPPKGPSGGRNSSRYSPNKEGSKSTVGNSGNGIKLCIQPMDLSGDGIDYLTDYCQGTGVFSIFIEESIVPQGKSEEQMAALRFIISSILLDWENRSGELSTPLSLPLDKSAPARQFRLRQTLTPGWRP